MSVIRRREFVALLGGAAAAWPLAAHAQQGQRVRRIGVLMGLVASDPEAQSRVAAFEHGLRELGWVKGRNLWIEYRWAGGGENVLRNHASELIAMAPDLILANSTPVTAALREQSRVVPIVFTQVTDPVGEGLVPNLAHPRGNLTGFTSFEFSIGTKWLELLKQTAPHVTRVALVFNPHSAPFADLFVRPVEAAAPSFSVTPIAAAVRATDDLDRVFDALAREANGGLIVVSDLGMTNHRDALIALAAHHRVPAVYPFRYFATSGGLMSYGTDVAEVFRRAAAYVDRILKGEKSGRPSGAGADQIRAGHQPQDRQGARPRHPVDAARPRRRGDRVKRREFITLLGGAAAALAGAFYHSVLLLLPHAVGLARLRAGRMVPDKPDIG